MPLKDPTTLEQSFHQLFVSVGHLQNALLSILENRPELATDQADEALGASVEAFQKSSVALAEYMGWVLPDERNE